MYIYIKCLHKHAAVSQDFKGNVELY